MIHVPRCFVVAALAACVLVSTVGACERDEPATYLPQSGEWAFEVPTIVNNSCSADATPVPLTGVLIDYDDGDSFQVELGEQDVNCEIDGVEFYCTDYTTTFVPDPELDILIRSDRTWEGEFISETEADVVEVYTVTCSGQSCEVVEDFLCTYKATFEAHAV